ncbi:hypothetical protein M0802_008647 [Mischocyttarus mexicanus]|nr:hypothetical protein M0802_008647 [Mischocyttarus mexicanus]
MSCTLKSATVVGVKGGDDTKEVDGTRTVLSRNMPTDSMYANKTTIPAFQNTLLGNQKSSKLIIKQTDQSVIDKNVKLINSSKIINPTINDNMSGLLKSESTESIDFWSEIKNNNEPELIKSVNDTKVELINSSSSSSSSSGSSSTSSSIKRQPDNKDKGNNIEIIIPPSTTPSYLSNNISSIEKKQRRTIVKSPLVENKFIKNKEEDMTVPKISNGKNNNKETIREDKKKLRKKADLVISIPPSSPSSEDVFSTVKRKTPLVKGIESSDKSSSSIVTSSVSTPTELNSELSTPVNEISVPLINVVGVQEVTSTNDQSEKAEIEDEDESPSTPTNEWTNSSITLISKWDNHDDLSNADDNDKTMTPPSSNETSLVTTPNDSQQTSPQSSKIKKKIMKKRKSSSKVVVNNEDDTNDNKKDSKKGSRNLETISKNRQETTTTTTTNTLKLPENSNNNSSRRLSPKNSPTQRPIDLIRMFYTTPSALLTATPRDLSKVKRAKIKRRRHQSRTPSVSSDSTGSTASTATTGSTDGSSASTSTELDDDTEHKRMASTRSNDSGFDGSPRISSIYINFYYYYYYY